jgi:hypothetical protein
MPAPLSEVTETAIRERAYYLWEQSGRPPGRDTEFWARAVATIGEAPAANVKPKAAKPAAAKAAIIASKRAQVTKLPAAAPLARSSKARAVKA